MNRLKTLLILGLFVSILPYLGFPLVLKNILITLSGFNIIYLSYVLYADSVKDEVKEQPTFENFSENQDFVNNDTEDKTLNLEKE